jgi:hypothetical protein
MWGTIKILLLAKAFLLTSHPIDIKPDSAVTFSKEISALNPGAAVHVDVSSMMPRSAMVDISTTRQWVPSHIPRGSLKATLYCPECNGNVHLTFNGHTSWDGKTMRVILDRKGGVPPGVKFTKVEVSSEVELRQVLVQWVNHGK